MGEPTEILIDKPKKPPTAYLLFTGIYRDKLKISDPKLNFGDVNVITHLIRRAKKFKIIPIICTTKNKSDDILEKISRFEKINFFRGSEKNKIKRWHDCSRKFNIKYFHTIDADDPFFDSISINKCGLFLYQSVKDL